MTTQTLTAASSPWHSGEITMQEKLGVVERMQKAGQKVIRDYMPDQHREFFSNLPYIAVGTVDEKGAPWATMLTGAPGFISSPDPRSLVIQKDGNDPTNPLFINAAKQDGIAFVGVDLSNRRRNRLNGRVRTENSNQWVVDVQHSFGNCPQYIQLHDSAPVAEASVPRVVKGEHSDVLTARAIEIITKADTFFVASYVESEDGSNQVDVSHRGGKAGFVRLDSDGSMTIPDFAGNLHFNTLGNFLVNPKAGLLFVDFETGDALHLTGIAEVILESPDIKFFQGAERLWRSHPEQVLLRKKALDLGWSFREWSKNSLITGDWETAAKSKAAEALKNTWRPFRVAQIIEESSTVKSFYLEPTDGNGTLPYRAGQHLPVRLSLSKGAAPVLRTYTLSKRPDGETYRISVRKQGVFSNHLHDDVKEGDIIEAKGPAGSFTLDTNARRPAVLLAAGIGITPLLAMAHDILFEGVRTRYTRPTWIFYAARNAEERAFESELQDLVQQSDGLLKYVPILKGDPNRDADHPPARLDMDFLRANLPFDDYDFYLCGPGSFMQTLYDGLMDLSISNDRIHAEAFGPAALNRVPSIDTMSPKEEVADKPVQVSFAKSGIETKWTPDSGSLLDLAEAVGLTPEFSCRTGSCGTCATRINAGKVAYEDEPSATGSEDSAFICCSMPAKGDAVSDNRLTLDM